MSKTMIIAAAVSVLVIATPAFAQDRGDPAGQSAGFGGRNGSATICVTPPAAVTWTRIRLASGRRGASRPTI